MEFNYIRFSTTPYNAIAAMYDIPTRIISAIFSTALLNAVGTDLEGQQIVDCRAVPR